MDVTIWGDFLGPCDRKCLCQYGPYLDGYVATGGFFFLNSHTRTPVNCAYSQIGLERALLLSLNGRSCKHSWSLSFAIAFAVYTPERRGAFRLNTCQYGLRQFLTWSWILESNVFVYYFIHYLFNNISILFEDSSGHNSVIVKNQTG